MEILQVFPPRYFNSLAKRRKIKHQEKEENNFECKFTKSMGKLCNRKMFLHCLIRKEFQLNKIHSQSEVESTLNESSLFSGKKSARD